jgi:hypothetical protein
MTIEVLLLTQHDCAFCNDARAVLARLGREFPLALSEEEFSSPRGRQLALDGGLFFPPGIVIEGRPFSYGRPSEGRLRRHFARLQS